MSEQLLAVSPSPHIHTELTVPQIMKGVIIAMLPAFALSIYNFGITSLYVTVLSVSFCVAAEYLITRYLLKKSASIQDGSAIITGMLLAFNVPSNLPWYIILIGSLVSIGIGKMSFGGLGNNPFNPALVGRVFLLLSFPVQMTSWPVAKATLSFDAVTSATPLGLLKEGIRAGDSMDTIMQTMPTYSDFFFGFQSGSLGEMSACALLLGLGYMLYRKIITWHIPVTMLATVLIMTGIFWLIDPNRFANPLFHVLTGGVMLGAVFMATDYVTSPVSHRGMIVFALGIGVLTVLIRLFGSYPEGVSFAILIMNAFVPMINTYIKQPRYGVQKEGKPRKEPTPIKAN
ncbi:MAG: RnfABCDGE type electron transport complex subunit D [Cyclobacteriaceae bacterium]|nr:RnfABCDGE type electron transport complex subunit D [Cyclobacteriaceae bacterium]